MGLGGVFLITPLVIFAHVCAIHFLFGFVKPKYSTFSQATKVLTWAGFILLGCLAFIAIPLWSTLFGLGALAFFASFSVSGFVILGSMLCMLLAFVALEAYIIYYQNYHTGQGQFSERGYAKAIRMSFGVLFLVLCLTFLLFSMYDLEHT